MRHYRMLKNPPAFLVCAMMFALPASAQAPTASTEDAQSRKGALTTYVSEYNFNTVELVIAPNEGAEFKYHLPQDGSLVFSWSSTGPLEHDYHSQPDTYPDDPSVSYEQSVVNTGNGSFVSPASGLYGWYWKNNSASPITVKVTGAGFFDYSVEMRANNFRKRHPVQSAKENISTPITTVP